ncbi:MAG: hypothetical protein AAAFM81_10885 [Pseudomonadota bacterium]
MEVTMLWWDNFDDHWHAVRHRILDGAYMTAFEARGLMLLAVALLFLNT